MTSKLDTAELVERLRAHADSQIEDDIVGYIQTADDLMLEAADLIEALTQAAAPDMAPAAWRADRQVDGEYTRKFTAIKRVAEIWGEQGSNVEPLYTASQLSAVQGERDALETLCDQRFNEIAALGTRLEAAEARVAELEATLKPFADAADATDFVRTVPEDAFLWGETGGDDPKHISIADVRRARAALAHKGEGRG